MARVAGTIRTARLILRPLAPGDADAIAAGLGNYDVVRWLATPPYPYTCADADAFIASARAQTEPIWSIDDGSGLQGVISIDPELGYWLARGAWGKGYATEAGDAAIDAWFRGTRAKSIAGSHFADNPRSARVLQKMGLRDVGPRVIHSNALTQDIPARQMRLTRRDWRARRRYRLSTARLRLRELCDGDLSVIQRVAGDPRVAPMLSSMTTLWPEDAARRWLESSKYRGRPGFRAAICTRWGKLIGTIYMGAAPGSEMPTCAGFLDPAFWGRGLMAEAAAAFLADTMDRFGVDILWADHFADNPAGGAVFRKLGFKELRRGNGTSAVRLEPAPIVIYRLDRSNLKACR